MESVCIDSLKMGRRHPAPRMICSEKEETKKDKLKLTRNIKLNLLRCMISIYNLDKSRTSPSMIIKLTFVGYCKEFQYFYLIRRNIFHIIKIVTKWPRKQDTQLQFLNNLPSRKETIYLQNIKRAIQKTFPPMKL